MEYNLRNTEDRYLYSIYNADQIRLLDKGFILLEIRTYQVEFLEWIVEGASKYLRGWTSVPE